jgi:predicted lactoylglutathione lyase
LFTFKDTEEDVEFYKWSGHNDHIQFSDENSIAVGGADGKFALYIRNNFYNGVSNK